MQTQCDASSYVELTQPNLILSCYLVLNAAKVVMDAVFVVLDATHAWKFAVVHHLTSLRLYVEILKQPHIFAQWCVKTSFHKQTDAKYLVLFF